MSKQLESNSRVVERKLVIAPVYPRVRVWTRMSFEEAIGDMVAMGPSILKIFKPSSPISRLPNTSSHGISDIYSDEELTGISNQELVGNGSATYVLYKGSLLVPLYSHPAEMRYALLQTIHSQQTVESTLASARAKLAELRNYPGVSRFIREG